MDVLSRGMLDMTATNMSLDDARAAGKKPNLDQASKAFETLFMQMIMKSMREAQLGEGLLDSEEAKPFQSMLDSAYAELMSKNMRLGLADSISRQLSPTIGKGAKK
ncbi:rod-binding protein [Rhizobiales bacterium TNE-4]|nr:rod-binding protein [Rhizobiales bacterium TNE-4]MBV1828625.1 rod-binding protein [Rhizobiales bacterium TNE-4]